ncbi:hypothetical protein N9V96_00990 [Polaribacter sp.]|nr:hypothetical protein [Polaribacter sp.]
MKKSILAMLFVSSLLVGCKDDDNEIDVEEEVVTEGQLDYTIGTQLDISGWDWKDASLGTIGTLTPLTGSISSDITLDAALTYSLSGIYSVESGATLTIPAGTKIVADAGTGVYIVVQKGGMINVQGTSSNPVVMSTESGNFGGLVICGDATTTEGVDATAEVGNLPYGGTNDSDNSGSISYLVINNAGAIITGDSQYNGLSLYAVGSGTTISNVSFTNGADDGIEFFGGTVSVTNLYSADNQDDAIDWTEGWNGTVTNAYISHSTDSYSTALEGDGDNGNPSFVNLTAVAAFEGTGMQFKKESGATITNLYLEGYSPEIDFRDEGAYSNVQIDGSSAVIIE